MLNYHHAVQVVREYFSDASADECEWILWNKTGWPEFWETDDHEECMRAQLYPCAILSAECIIQCERCFLPAETEYGGADLCSYCATQFGVEAVI